MEKNTLNKLEYQFLSLDIVFFWASLLTQLVKKPPAMQEIPVQSLGWEDALEKGKGYPFQYSGLEKSMDGMYSPWGHKELDTTE